VEAIIARHTVARGLYLVVPIIGIAFLARGADGALAAGIGLVIVVANLYLSGWLMSRAIRHSLNMYHAAALVGFVLRMALIAGTMLVIVQFVEIDRPAFGISAVVSYLVLVTWEAISVMRGGERNLDWA
jgi:hypothetical protein